MKLFVCLCLLVLSVYANTDVKFDFKGLLSGAPLGCNCGEVPADCSQCVTGRNGWLCRPRDCTYCSYGINGFPCAGDNCTTCQFGINGWPCQKAASFSTCLLEFDVDQWKASARLEIDQQNDFAWVKLYVSSNQPMLGIQLRSTDGVAWQVYPQNAAQVGVPIHWARLPSATMFSYPNPTIPLGFDASQAAFNIVDGRIAADYIIPVMTTGLGLMIQREGNTTYLPAPSTGQNTLTCQTSTNFQQDAINAMN